MIRNSWICNLSGILTCKINIIIITNNGNITIENNYSCTIFFILIFAFTFFIYFVLSTILLNMSKLVTLITLNSIPWMRSLSRLLFSFSIIIFSILLAMIKSVLLSPLTFYNRYMRLISAYPFPFFFSSLEILPFTIFKVSFIFRVELLSDTTKIS